MNMRESRIEGNRIDKKVNMKYFNEKQEGQMEIEFEEKSIPFEFKLMEDTFEGTFRLSGSFEEGEISVLLLSPDERIEWKKVYKFGQLNVEELFALYGGDDYILRIEFINAKKRQVEDICYYILKNTKEDIHGNTAITTVEGI